MSGKIPLVGLLLAPPALIGTGLLESARRLRPADQEPWASACGLR
jgi:hypothetical protein